MKKLLIFLCLISANNTTHSITKTLTKKDIQRAKERTTFHVAPEALLQQKFKQHSRETAAFDLYAGLAETFGGKNCSIEGILFGLKNRAIDFRYLRYKKNIECSKNLESNAWVIIFTTTFSNQNK